MKNENIHGFTVSLEEKKINVAMHRRWPIATKPTENWRTESLEFIPTLCISQEVIFTSEVFRHKKIRIEGIFLNNI